MKRFLFYSISGLRCVLDLLRELTQLYMCSYDLGIQHPEMDFSKAKIS
jgi:hypothetical protein